MEFASKYGYDYGHQGSDEEDDDVNNNNNNNNVNPAGQPGASRRRTQLRKADSNIIAVKFDQLILPNEMFAGEPIKCGGCGAFMTAYSKKRLIETTKVWPCEFCAHANDLLGSLGSLEEIPNFDDVTFLIEAAPQKPATDAAAETKQGSLDSNYLTYCVDISGSMDTQIEIKNNNEPNTAANMTRLEGVKTACVENIKMLKEKEPNKRVGLVTFSDTVKFYGDASKIKDNTPLVEVGQAHNMRNYFQQSFVQSKRFSPQQETEDNSDLLNNQEKLLALAKNQSGDLKPIKDTAQLLELRIKGLRTEGSTALGPAMVFSVGFCSKQAGSAVLLCTDGAANIGMGTINDASSEKFYEDLADYSRAQNVTVNVISMEGTDCKLALLGKVADKTNGTINIVNPLNLSAEFKSILENRVVATNVVATLIVNTKYLYIRDEALELAEAKAIESQLDKETADVTIDPIKKSIVKKDIGNANIDTEITFEYGVRKLRGEEGREALKELPFQLQVAYETSDGAKAVRVYNKVQEFTRDRGTAESNLVSRDLIYSNAAQKMSAHALCSNVAVSKMKQAQISNYRTRNNWEAPSELMESEAVIRNLSNSQRAEDLRDSAATSLFAAKKINRAKFSKQ
jgi:Mg-chelatase subunit ChlD